jgi:hypothetical protein
MAMAATPISVARHRATLAKRTLAFGSVLAFALTIGFARSSHPARAATSTPSSGATQAPSGDGNGYGFGTGNTGNSGFGQANVGPAQYSQTPSVSTGAS